MFLKCATKEAFFLYFPYNFTLFKAFTQEKIGCQGTGTCHLVPHHITFGKE